MIRLRVLQCFVLTLFVSGCAGLSNKPSSVILQNPETMEFVNCDVDGWGTAASYRRNQACVEGYRKEGYIVWGER